MVWSRKDPSDNKERYIKRIGNAVVLTKDSKDALDDVPDGWDIKEINGHLRVKKK